MPPTTLTAAVAAEVRGQMAKRKLSQGALAEFMQVNPKTISRLLNTTHPIDLSELEKIGLFLGLDPLELMAKATAS